MDLKKIGTFIASIRKEKGYTQKQLAEKLNLSEKTISKWERGAGFPDVSSMLPLCRELCIDLNELLTGERISSASYKEHAEENLIYLMAKTTPKQKYIITTISSILCVLSVLFIMVISAYHAPQWMCILLVLPSIIVLFSVISLILVIAVDTEIYECEHCKRRFIPKMLEYVMAPHTIRRRYLKCPECKKHAWNKFYLNCKNEDK